MGSFFSERRKGLDKIIRVIVVDDNDIVRQMIVDTLSEEPGIEVIAEASQGDEAVGLIKKLRPDLVLLDLVMPKVDGIGVMEAISKEPDVNPEYIVVSAAGREDIISEALQMGASYFFMKPYDGEALIKRIKHIYNKDDARQPEIAAVKGKENGIVSLETRVVSLLRNIGVPIKMVGYKYLRDAIITAVNDPDALMSITKNVYPDIAEVHGTSAGNVERNIRYVIETTWARIKEGQVTQTTREVFKNLERKPTNSEFILLCSEWIALQ